MRSNLLSGNAGDGVYVNGSTSTGNVIAGNFIGTTANGLSALPNTTWVSSTTFLGNGVEIAGAASNTIGGTTVADRNIISGNVGNGVYINGTTATNNVVEGNYIGTDATGNVGLGNTNGVEIVQRLRQHHRRRDGRGRQPHLRQR